LAIRSGKAGNIDLPMMPVSRYANPPWRRDSNETASGKPGAVHIYGKIPLDVGTFFEEIL
jgi:hypothetical protein